MGRLRRSEGCLLMERVGLWAVWSGGVGGERKVRGAMMGSTEQN